MAAISRRKIILSGAAGLANAGLQTGASAQGEPVRIGVITQLSGYAQAFGTAQRIGAEIAADIINEAGGIAGRHIELVFRDDKGSTEAAVNAFRELMSSGVKLFIGGPISGPAVAVGPLLANEEALFIGSGPTILSLTHESFNKNVFRLAFTSIPYHGAVGEFAARSAPDVQDWDIITQDAQALIDIVTVIGNAIRRVNTGKTISIAEPLLAKGGAGDFRGQLAQLSKTKASGIIVGLVGSDCLTFLKQGKAFGLDRKYKIFVDNGNALQLPKALAAALPVNIWSPTLWFASKDSTNPVSLRLMTEYERRMSDEFPFGYVATAHDAVVAYAEAAKQAGSLDIAALRSALERGDPLGAGGPIRFRKEDHAYQGDLTTINFGGDANAPDGWQMKQVIRVASADRLEPATPGQKLDIH